MTLNKVKKLKHFIKLAPLCNAIGLNVETLKARLKRGSPELSKEEGNAILKVIEKLKQEFKSN